MPASSWAKKTGFKPRLSGDTNASDSGQIVAAAAPVKPREAEPQPDLESGRAVRAVNGGQEPDKMPATAADRDLATKKKKESDGGAGVNGQLRSEPPPVKHTREEEVVDALPQSYGDEGFVARHSHMKYELRDTPGLVPIGLYGFQHYLSIMGSLILIPLVIVPAMGGTHSFKHIMKELQGAIIISSAFQAIMGYSGLMSIFLRLINPVVLSPTIAAVGLSFFSYGFPQVGTCLEIGILQILVVIIFSLYLRKVSVFGHRIFLIYAVSLYYGVVVYFLLNTTIPTHANGVRFEIGIVDHMVQWHSGPENQVSPISSGSQVFITCGLLVNFFNHLFLYTRVAHAMTMLAHFIFSKSIQGHLPDCVHTWMLNPTYASSYFISIFYYMLVMVLYEVPLGLAITWAVAFLLTEAGAYNYKGCDINVPASNIISDACRKHVSRMKHCRVDTSRALKSSPWFRFPYPLQWGVPVFDWKMAIVMCAVSIIASVDSVGSYHASSLLVASRPPTPGVLSRGLGLEGLSSVLAGLWGTGTGSTTLTENVHTIAVTKMGSRRAVELGAIVLILLSLVGKVGGFLASIPDVMVAALLCFMWGMLAALGLSNLRYSEAGSSRNIIIVGLSLFFSLSIPAYFQQYGVAPNANSPVPRYFQPYIVASHGPFRSKYGGLNYVMNTVLSFHMVIAFLVALILDNTVPGSRQERGVYVWSEAEVARREPAIAKDYELPFRVGRVFRWVKWVGL